MRIGIVSSYIPIECGIATYTSYLITELKKQDLNNEVYIISQHGGKGERVHPVFNADDPDLSARIFERMLKLTPDICHIQHEFGLFGKDFGVNIIPLFYRLKFAGISIVTTLHTIYPNFNQSHKLIIRTICELSNAIIVHEDFQKESILKNIGRFNNIYVIPHGVREVKLISEAKKKLQIENKKAILICGYFRPTKCFEKVIKIFPDIVAHIPEAVLIVAGKLRSQEHTSYRDYLFKLIETSPSSDRILLLRGQFPQEVFDIILSSADVAVLPYKHGAQSGVLAHCIAFRRPIVASNLPVFEKWVNTYKLGFVTDDDDEYAANIVNILKDNNLAKEMSNNARKLIKEKLSWEIVTKKTIDIYHKIVRDPYGKAKYLRI